MATIELSIVQTKNGNKEIKVEPDSCPASLNEDVEWQPLQGITRWMVVLEGQKKSGKVHPGNSPFTEDKRIFEGQGPDPKGGKLKGKSVLKKGDRFKYLVLCWDADGSYHKDPDIVIEDIVARKP